MAKEDSRGSWRVTGRTDYYGLERYGISQMTIWHGEWDWDDTSDMDQLEIEIYKNLSLKERELYIKEWYGNRENLPDTLKQQFAEIDTTKTAQNISINIFGLLRNFFNK